MFFFPLRLEIKKIIHQFLDEDDFFFSSVATSRLEIGAPATSSCSELDPPNVVLVTLSLFFSQSLLSNELAFFCAIADAAKDSPSRLLMRK